MPIRVLLAEDDAYYAQLLYFYVEALDYVPVGPAGTVEEALSLYQQSPRPELALLDINLSGELNGIDLAHELLALQPLPIIFLTASADEELFMRAKSLRPAAFLTKPFDQRTLGYAIELALHNFAGGMQTRPITEGAPLTWNQDAGAGNHLFLRDRGRFVKVNISDIQYVEAADKYCTVVGATGKFALRLPLRDLASELPAASFVQIQRGYLVNVSYIEQVDLTANVLVVAGTELPLGRVYREAVFRQLRLLG